MMKRISLRDPIVSQSTAPSQNRVAFAKRRSAVAMVAKTKELKKRYGAEEGEESSRQFWKEPSRASGSSFQRLILRPGTSTTHARRATDGCRMLLHDGDDGGRELSIHQIAPCLVTTHGRRRHRPERPQPTLGALILEAIGCEAAGLGFDGMSSLTGSRILTTRAYSLPPAACGSARFRHPHLSRNS